MSFTKTVSVLSSIILIVWINPIYSQVMQGVQYQMKSDSINFGGGRSSSGSYIVEDTLGEISSGHSTSTSFNLYAGYQQMNLTFFSITPAPDVSMSPSIAGLSGGTSNGTTSVAVITDNSAGYEINIKASTSPSLKSSDDSFSDYVSVGENPDYDFSFDTDESVFGMSVYGDDITSDFKNNNSDACGTGSTITYQKCWDGLSISDNLIVQSTASNHPLGTETEILFRAGSGSGAYLTEGDYEAQITLTILPR
jgi:hypothetical protein